MTNSSYLTDLAEEIFLSLVSAVDKDGIHAWLRICGYINERELFQNYVDSARDLAEESFVLAEQFLEVKKLAMESKVPMRSLFGPARGPDIRIAGDKAPEPVSGVIPIRKKEADDV